MGRKYGRWEVIGSVGEGGQAHLFRVLDSTKAVSGERVLKRLKNVERKDLFDREIRAITGLQHPNILRIDDYELVGDSPYYVAEHCERGSLAKVGADRFRGDVRASLEALLPIVDALNAAHRTGVIHRDVKPPNILFRADGTPVLADFGICHVDGDRLVTLTDEAMGSVNYIAPEMESGRRLGPPTDVTDVYSLGKVLFWMISGGHIFGREDHRGRPLPEILGGQQFEHIHLLLDEMVVEDPRRRIPMRLLKTRLQEMEALVMGDFAPLKPSIGLRCRFCGLGTYVKHIGPKEQRVSRIGLQNIAGTDVRALVCTRCGHLEIFDFGATTDKTWWDQ